LVEIPHDVQKKHADVRRYVRVFSKTD